MADNGYDGERQFPYPLIREGKGYEKALKSRSQAILETLLGFLASNYKTSIPSTEYSYYLRAISTELAKFTLTLEELSTDISFDLVRSEFLQQVVGYLIFVDGEMPDIDFDDEEFRSFLLKILDIFFQGSTPESIAEAVELFTDQEFEIVELYEEARRDNSPYDISNQFEFQIEFDASNGLPDDLFRLQRNLKLLLNIVKPAHTLYSISHVFGDIFKPDGEEIEDDLTWLMHDRRYDDFRKYCGGLAGFESDTGYIQFNAFDILRDDADDKPLSSVRAGANITIFEGPNTGIYEAIETVGTNGVRVRPRFQEAEIDISYKTEVDRLGYKQEKYSQEDVSSQFVSPIIFEVSLNGPYSVFEFNSITLTASSNFSGDVTYNWDFDGDGVFDDATGEQVTYNAGSGPKTVVVGVYATASDGRTDRANAEINIIV